MGITQNGVVWIKKQRGSNFAVHSEFCYIAKFHYHSVNCRHSENLNFAMHSNFRFILKFGYHSENLAIAKFR